MLIILTWWKKKISLDVKKKKEGIFFDKQKLCVPYVGPFQHLYQ